MAEPSPIDRMFSEAKATLDVLSRSDETSLQIAAADQFRKSLLLAAASYFETRLCAHVVEFVRESAVGTDLVENFVRNKAVSRQYHTWFDWKTTNANQFYRLFGEGFSAHMKAILDNSDEAKRAVTAFMELGSERNKLVHQDYSTFPLEKTLDEIYELYLQANEFVELMPNAFRLKMPIAVPGQVVAGDAN